MSHELRTPLNAIIGYSQMILAGMAGEIDSQQRDYQERIFANGKNLLDLINDILDLAKIEAGRMDMVKKPLVLRDWLDEVVHQTQALADAKGLKFESELDRRMPDIIVGDPGRLKQIAFNLLSNAVKFTEKGHVKLSIRRQGQATWTLVVIDTGIGIPSHAQEYIFDEFRQVDGTSRREYGGSGLGLAVVRNLALMMGGNVRVSSRVQEGSTFTVLLPLITEEMLSRDEKHPEIQKV
jgi:two-component system chemotaxis sensor kinase CheA